MQEGGNARPKKRCNLECQKHKFSFFNADDDKFDCEIKFCPKYHRQPKLHQNTFPIFNFDSKYYTSGFILGVDRKALANSQHQQLGEHNRQIRQSLEKDIKVIFPKPRKRNSWCMICKEEYKSYFKHIMSIQHKSILDKKQYNSQIISLTERYKDMHTPSAPSPITIINISTASNTLQNQENCNGKSQQMNIKQIIQLVISSDSDTDQDQIQVQSIQSEKSQKRNDKYNSKSEEQKTVQNQTNNTGIQNCKSSFRVDNNSQSQEQQSNSKLNQNTLNSQDDDSDSVEIVDVKPAKKRRNEREESVKKKNKHKKIVKQKKSKRKKKSQKKQKSQKDQNSQKQQKKKSKSKKKKKKKKSQKEKKNNKESKDSKQKKPRGSSQQSRQRRKNSIKRRPLDPPPSTPPLIHKRMAFKGATRFALPPQEKYEVVLIQKMQIQDMATDKTYQKILENIVSTINKGPPAEAPRQYRKAGDVIDARIAPSARVTHSVYSQTGSQSKTPQNSKTNPNSPFEQRQNSQSMSVTAKQLSVVGSQQSNKMIDKDSNVNANSKKREIEVFDLQEKKTYKPGWQKLRNNVISSILQEQNKGQLGDNQVVELQHIIKNKSQAASSKSVKNIPKPELISLGFTKKKPNIVGAQEVNRRAVTTSSCLLILKDTSFKSQQNQEVQIVDDVVDIKIPKKYNDFDKGIVKSQETTSIFQSKLQNSQSIMQQNIKNINKKVNPPNIITPLTNNAPIPKLNNQHLVRKIIKDNFQQKNIGGVIDLELEEVSQVQSQLHRRQNILTKDSTIIRINNQQKEGKDCEVNFIGANIGQNLSKGAKGKNEMNK